MNCFYHSDTEATDYCSICGKPICEECKCKIEQTTLCKSCGQKALKFLVFSRNEKIKSKGLVFLFSLLPGAGHMYLNLMNRGIQLMAAFFLVLSLPDILGNDFVFQAFAIIIYVFNIFGAQNQVMLFNSGEGNDKSFINKEFIKKNSFILMVLIICIGIWGILSQIFKYSIYTTLNKYLLPVSFIVLGVYLIKDVFFRENKKMV